MGVKAMCMCTCTPGGPVSMANLLLVHVDDPLTEWFGGFLTGGAGGEEQEREIEGREAWGLKGGVRRQSFVAKNLRRQETSLMEDPWTGV